MKQPILFNHIPRTGGTTLRIILNRVYGEDNLFFIRSKDIRSSLEEFRAMGKTERTRFRVISGHGAMLFKDLLDKPLLITILREPVSLFISQYHYLKSSPNSNFLDEVRALGSFDDYIPYALKNGQDNMLTRILCGRQEWLINDVQAPKMAEHGMIMLGEAKKKLHDYDALIDLGAFNEGVFALSKLLEWKRIPLYRVSNKGNETSSRQEITKDMRKALEQVLQYDIALYNYFRENKIGIDNIPQGRGESIFLARQKIIEAFSRIQSKI